MSCRSHYRAFCRSVLPDKLSNYNRLYFVTYPALWFFPLSVKYSSDTSLSSLLKYILSKSNNLELWAIATDLYPVEISKVQDFHLLSVVDWLFKRISSFLYFWLLCSQFVTQRHARIQQGKRHDVFRFAANLFPVQSRWQLCRFVELKSSFKRLCSVTRNWTLMLCQDFVLYVLWKVY
jgi:hypothetical protein